MISNMSDVISFLQDIEGKNKEEKQKYDAYRFNYNKRILILLRGIEIFVGNGKCPVCGSPNKWQEGKKPTDKQRKDLHIDQCELLKIIDSIEFAIKNCPNW